MKFSLFLTAFAALQQCQARKTGRRAQQIVNDETLEDTGFFMSFVRITSNSFETAPTKTPPTPEPTPEPSPVPPTPTPTLMPIPPPVCVIDVELNCTSLEPDLLGIPCSDIPPIDSQQQVCSCPECVKEIKFTFTGNRCDGLEGCFDTPGPANATAIKFYQCDSSNMAFSQPLFQGDIVLSFGGIACLPACMDVEIVNAADDVVQSFRLDTSCIGDRGFVLQSSYGALSFSGYSCDDDDVNNCILPVSYDLEACNEGLTDEFLYDLLLYVDVGVADFVESPISLPAGSCFDASINTLIDRCSGSTYSAFLFANFTNPITNEPSPCEGEDSLQFSFPNSSLAPTPSPTVYATSDCQIDILVEPVCPIVNCEWNRCIERPFRMEFRVIPAPCSATTLRRCPTPYDNTCTCERNRTLSPEEWPGQKVFCIDDPDGLDLTIRDYREVDARPERETFWVVMTPEKDPSVIYYSGPIEFGTEVAPGGNGFNGTDPNLQRVESNSYLRLYTADPATGGEQLQEVLFHSSCSEELWLFDIYGSFQLVEFEAIDSGIIGSFQNVELFFELEITPDAAFDSVELDSMSIVLLSENEGEADPQIEEFDFEGESIPPPLIVDWQVALTPEVEYLVVTTIGGTLSNGETCYDVSEQRIFCPRVIIPGELPPSDRRML